MPFSFHRHPALAGLSRHARREVRRLAWHFAQRHWSLHAPAFLWLVFVLLHLRVQFVPERRDYLIVTFAFFVAAVINIRLHIAHYLKPARAIHDLLGDASLRTITSR